MSLIQYICFCVLAFITAINSAEICVKINSCSCRNSSGVLDLSPLASSDSEPTFKDVEGSLKSYYYSWNPCTPFTEDPTNCVNVSACKTNMNEYYSLGTPDSATFVTDETKGLMLQYSSTGIFKRHLEVILVCDPSTNSSLSVKGETHAASLHHEMTLRSKYCCFQPDDTSTTESSTPFTDSSSELPSGSTGTASDSTMPFSGSTNPDTGSTNPDTGSTYPNTGSTNPNTGSTNPNTGSTNPNTGSTMTITTPESSAPTMLPLSRFIVIIIMVLLKFAF
ncbi:hypothetical protein LOTGIDRAFT_235904 [Lottia gigantea]|uniref:MRH domain-containing protein n=1 Tax=Lottia gigantea TaxID=225164 RepID=V3ZLP7_LOTGI|nr:hypothetical protein LOTGIDRAFT_235904 [Lottia gigantea]ESO85227.1 hypothetical protein LOTGIDRAFT_235904 [Lottia gigantea]